MPDGIDPEWLARTMADCSSADGPTRHAAWDALARAIWPGILDTVKTVQRRSWASAAGPTITEDVAMHVFTKLMQHIERVEPPKLFGWVCIVARNYIISLGTRGYHKNECLSPYEEEWDDAAGVPIHRDQSRQLSAAACLIQEMKELPESDRQLLFDYYWLERTMSEIARDLGLSRPGVSRRIHVATARLRAVLTEAGYNNSSGATTDFG